MVGDAQGNLYYCANLGKANSPNFRTYSKSKDRIDLKLSPKFNFITKRTTYEPVEFMNYATPFIVDWNGDGKRDLLVGEGTYSVNAIRLFLNPGNQGISQGSRDKEKYLFVGEKRTFLSPSAYDWDGDGNLDLIICDSKGVVTVHPNPNGEFTGGEKEMTTFKTLTFEGHEDTSRVLGYCTPQPCDWNADGVMDLIWGGRGGEIRVSLGKVKGGVEFSSPEIVKSNKIDELLFLKTIKEKSIHHAAVPFVDTSFGGQKSKDIFGGSANSQRYYDTAAGIINNINGMGTGKRFPIHGLLPSFTPEQVFDAAETTGGATPRGSVGNAFASWGIAPVPYDVWQVIQEKPPNAGEGNTLSLTWHEPVQNLVFKQNRDQLTRFGHGAQLHIGTKGGPYSDNRLEVGKGVRLSFHVKLEGKFTTMRSKIHNRDRLSKGGFASKGNRHLILPFMDNPPHGKWFEVNFAFPPPDQAGVKDAKSDWCLGVRGISILWLGRGDISIRDVQLTESDTWDEPANKKK